MAIVRPPSSTCSEATSARLGTRSVRSGAITASLTASRPTRIVPSSSTHTSDGTYFEPSISRTSVRPSASVAVVVNEVPKSIARSQPFHHPAAVPAAVVVRRGVVGTRVVPGVAGVGAAWSSTASAAEVGGPGRRSASSVVPVAASTSPSPSASGSSPTDDGEHVLPDRVGQLGVVDRERRGQQAAGRRTRARCPGRCRGSATCPATRPDPRPLEARSRRLLSVGGQPRRELLGGLPQFVAATQAGLDLGLAAGSRRSSRSPGSSRARRGSR